MPADEALTPRQAERDAVLTCAVATVCSLAFVAFLVLPMHDDAMEVPAALEGAWLLGFLVGAFLAPVAAGLAAFVSGSVLRGSQIDLDGAGPALALEHHRVVDGAACRVRRELVRPADLVGLGSRQGGTSWTSLLQ